MHLLFPLYTTYLVLKLMYSEKATKYCKIYAVDLSYVVQVKYTVEISQTFVAFSEYMNLSMYNKMITCT